MNVIEFGNNGKSDKVIMGRIYRTQDLSVVAIIDVRLAKDKQPIGLIDIPLDKARELPLIDQWIFSDTKSIDIMITELSDLKGKLEKDKTLYENTKED